MTRSERLDPLLRVVQQRQDDAARVVGERERAQAEQEARLDALRRYAEEYSAAPASAGNTIAPALLANRIAFRAKLDAAVAQQIQRGRQRAPACRDRAGTPDDRQPRNQGPGKTGGELSHEESRAAEQRTQRELDDLGARRTRTQAAGAGEEPAP
jgi:flagellar FliJ protein